MEAISYLKSVGEDLVCRIYPKARVYQAYIPETHPNFFMREGFLDSFEKDIVKDADINIIIGSLTYSSTRKSDELPATYKKLIEEGVLVAFNPEIKEDGIGYSGNHFLSSFEKPLQERQFDRIGKRKSKVVIDLYKESLPIEDFSAPTEELEKKFYAMKSKKDSA